MRAERRPAAVTLTVVGHRPTGPPRAVLLAVGCLTLACLWATPALAQSDPDSPLLTFTLIAYGASAGADLGATGYCLGAGTCHEANPLFRPFVQHHVAVAGAVKMTVTGVTVWQLIRHRQEHPRAVFWTTVALTALNTYAAVRNSRLK